MTNYEYIDPSVPNFAALYRVQIREIPLTMTYSAPRVRTHLQKDVRFPHERTFTSVLENCLRRGLKYRMLSSAFDERHNILCRLRLNELRAKGLPTNPTIAVPTKPLQNSTNKEKFKCESILHSTRNAQNAALPERNDRSFAMRLRSS